QPVPVAGSARHTCAIAPLTQARAVLPRRVLMLLEHCGAQHDMVAQPAHRRIRRDDLPGSRCPASTGEGLARGVRERAAGVAVAPRLSARGSSDARAFFARAIGASLCTP